MRINCHSHIFNLKSVFTRKTVEILLRRLVRENETDNVLVRPASRILEKAIVDNVDFDEEEIFRELAGHLAKSKTFKSLLKKAGDAVPVELELIGKGDAADLALPVLKGAFGKLTSLFSDDRKEMKDAVRTDPWDIIDFLRVALMPTVGDVTDRIMGQLDDDEAIVALMMDITPGDGSDAKLFKRQIRDTSQAVLNYPGRIFPFFAVNPARGNYLKLMKSALHSGGFVGVKLYPSLGYKLDTPQMETVFKYCARTETPLLMHCNHGGFYARKTYVPFGDPKYWSHILEQHKNLKICFGHFGGDECVVKRPISDKSWTNHILNLMKTYTGVYADIAYHTHPTKSQSDANNYFANLKEWLGKGSPYRERILFGTDFFLVRQRMRESSYWTYFQKKLGADAFKQIAELNPVKFLGLSEDAPGKNISHYIDFVIANSDKLKRDAAPWLAVAAETKHGAPMKLKGTAVAETKNWSLNNLAHKTLYEDFKRDFLEPTPFPQAGMLKLSTMVYLRNLRHGSAAMKRAKLRGRAVKLIKAFRDAGATQVPKKNDLIKALKNGSKTLAELGADCDKMFLFV